MSEETAPVGGTIEVNAKKDEKEATLNYDFGADLDAAVALFGAEVVFTNYRKSAKIDLQAVMRRYLTAGKDCAELVGIWKPGVTLERIVDPKAAAKNAFAKMDADEKKAFIAELKASL
ncbi:hypothetical protein KAR91_22110 [Candidatus Pacearchaeota archaeon]|nr:hypothetical protein [Candidatus Pacearchaeota archaeon]